MPMLIAGKFAKLGNWAFVVLRETPSILAHKHRAAFRATELVNADLRDRPDFNHRTKSYSMSERGPVVPWLPALNTLRHETSMATNTEDTLYLLIFAYLCLGFAFALMCRK